MSLSKTNPEEAGNDESLLRRLESSTLMPVDLELLQSISLAVSQVETRGRGDAERGRHGELFLMVQ